MIKRDELRSPASCLNKAQADEPIFVLRGHDPLAPQVIRLWAAMAGGLHEETQIIEALSFADDMETWRNELEKPVLSPGLVTSSKRSR